MAPPIPIEEWLRRLRAIRDKGDLNAIRESVVKYLENRSNLVVAEAATMVGEYELYGVELSLVSAFQRLVEHSDPIKADKGCTAKAAIVHSLCQLSYDDPDFYLAAITYKQIEPSWPQPEDTAENVRANCAFGIARSKQLRVVDKLITFVSYMQGTRMDRIHAAKALADTGQESAIPVLRMKLFSGDFESEVMGTCMTGLLDLAPDSSIPIVAGFLSHSNDNLVLEAAASLGTCGRPKAIEALITAWNRKGNKDIQRSLLLSIGMSRDPTAVNFLISRLESSRDTKDVLEALKPSCVYLETQARVREVLENIGKGKSSWHEPPES